MEPIGTAVIGVGNFGENHARVYAQDPRTHLVAVCDLEENRARSLAERLGADFWTSSADELMACSDIAAVSIATPDFAHRDLALRAAQAGKHILCEKPLATTTTDARAILRAVEDAGVTLMVDFHNRFNPPFVHAWRALREGTIGRPQYLHLRLSDTIYVPTTMLPWAEKSSVAWFLGSHCVDLVRWLTGGEVERLYAKAGRRVLAARGIETPDFCVSTLEMSDGSIALIENCWILGEEAPAVFEFGATIIGSEGHIHIGASPHSVFTITDEEGHRCKDVLAAMEIHGRWAGFAVEAIRHFIAVLRGETELVVGGRDGLEATRVVCAMEESIAVGTPVDLTVDWP